MSMNDRAQRNRPTRRVRVTYANVVATIALLVALSGTAWAAASIGSAQIRNNSIRSADVRNNALRSQDFSSAVRTQLNALPSSAASGTLIRGAYGASGKATAGGEVVRSVPSYPVPVTAPTTSEIVSEGGLPTTNCPGNVDEPDALPGVLCLYEYVGVNSTVIVDAPAGAGSMQYGWVAQISADAAGDYQSRGTWAYTVS